MFDKSVSLSRFAAGSGMSAVEGRVRRLEAMIEAMEQQRRLQLPADDANRTEKAAFKSFLGNASPPPAIQPLTSDIHQRAEQFQPMIQKYARQYGVDIDLINAVIRQESAFNPNAVSSAGAQGLMQLMPATAKGLGVTNPFDPEQNLQGGIRHLAGLLQKYHGNLALALAAYNAGGGAVDRFQGIPPYRETQNYVRKILAAYLSAKNNASTPQATQSLL